MTRTPKRWMGAFLALFATGFILLNALAWNHARSMMRFTPGGARTGKPEQLSFSQRLRVLAFGVSIPRPASERRATDLDPKCRRVSITGADSVMLGAWYCDRGTGTPLVILFHGYSAEKSSLLTEARIFLDLGASVLLVDFRGSGESSESYTTIGFREADDVSAAMRYATNSLSHRRILLYGQSMGAAAILRAIHRGGIRPDGVIAEAVFDSLLTTVRHRFSAMGVPSFPSAELLVFWGGVQAGFNGFTLEPVAWATALTCPSLFMHGTEDPRARIEEGRRVCAAAPGPAQFVAFPAAGHESYASRFPAEWTGAVRRFLTRTAIP